jgi:hypothetical protein
VRDGIHSFVTLKERDGKEKDRQYIYNQAKMAKTPTSKAPVLLSSLPKLSAAAPADCVADGPEPECDPLAPEPAVCVGLALPPEVAASS